MSQQQKFPMPLNPYRLPFPYSPINPDKIKSPSANLGPTGMPNPSTLPPNIQPGTFMPPRMYNPYMGGYGMFAVPPISPYHPYFQMMPPPTPSLQP